MTKLETIDAWFRRVWTEREPGAIEEMFRPEGIARGLGANLLFGPNEFGQFRDALGALFTDITVTVDHHIEQDDWISCICTFRATTTETGTPVTATGSTMVRIVDGILVEAYNHWDFISIFEGAGYFPPNGFMTALSGKRIA